jgi:prephenate dehydrogenase
MKQENALKSSYKTLIIGNGGIIAELMIDIFYALGFKELTGLDKIYSNNKKLIHFIKLNMSSNLTISQRDMFTEFDIIIFATPFDPFKSYFPQIYSHLKPTAILIDLFSIKSNYMDFIKEYDNKLLSKISFISMNPLFRPDLPTDRKKFLVYVYKPNESTLRLLNELKNVITLIELNTAEEHDRLMCFNQVAPHFMILALATFLSESGISYKRLKSTNTAYMEVIHCIISRILAGKTHVYWEIQSMNMFCKDSREKLATIVQDYLNIFDDNNEQLFNQKFAKLRDYFEDIEAYNCLFKDILNIANKK